MKLRYYLGFCWECRRHFDAKTYEHVLEKLEDHAMATGHAAMDMTECSCNGDRACCNGCD